LLLEAGGADLKPGILITETWFFNQGSELDWNFAAERSPSVNNRSIAQAAGKALGGGTSINGMVWARGHKNDFDRLAREAGDEAWGYQHILDIYRRIEDWQGVADPQRRGRGGEVFVQPARDPSPLAPAFLQAGEDLGYPISWIETCQEVFVFRRKCPALEGLPRSETGHQSEPLKDRTSCVSRQPCRSERIL
jgi:choline dehydrogenase